jgi:hypothetical protein
VSANDLFGKFEVDRSLILGPPPAQLNARIILGRGEFEDLEARDRNARFKWTFPDGTQARLTDRLKFQVDAMPAGDAHVIITRHDGSVSKIPLIGGETHTLTFWNRDNDDVGQETHLPPKEYELTEFDTLHALIGKSHFNPKGDYPMGLKPFTGAGISNDEPICGGEEGEPDPPPPDPSEP